MYWSISSEVRGVASGEGAAGRFVLHSHTDERGAHLDLRLEESGYLSGFRIEAASLDQDCCATEKAPHPLRWLEADGDAMRLDAGTYCWVKRDSEECALELRGLYGVRMLRLQRGDMPDATSVRDIAQCCRELGFVPSDAPQLLRDGDTARRRATDRFCALGRELDAEAFDEAVWRRTLSALTLEQIHAHLRGYELRFDRKYPPQPHSVPEALPEIGGSGDASAAYRERACNVLEIARG